MDDTKLIALASTCIARIRPNSSDSESTQDCWQTAYCAGLHALRSVEARRQKPSSRYLLLCMQSAVYRFLNHRNVDVYDDVPEPTSSSDDCDALDAREFIKEHLAALTPTQQRTVIAFYSGKTAQEIAEDEGIKYKAVHARIKTALGKMRNSSNVN